jgi:hypothetical protein
VEVNFCTPIQTSHGAHPDSHTMGTGSFPGVTWLGHGIEHPPPSTVEVKARVELYIPSLSGPVLGWLTPFSPFTFVRFEVLQCYFWNFSSFRLWCCVFGLVFPDIPKEHRAERSRKGLLGLLDYWRQRHYVALTYGELLNQWCSGILQKTLNPDTDIYFCVTVT